MIGEALRQVGASNFDLPLALGPELADRALQITLNKRGVGANRLQRARDSIRAARPGNHSQPSSTAITSRPMMRRTSVQIVLWLFVLSAGLLSGASVFEHVVLTPLWAGSLPQSVRDWPHGGIQGRFFMIASPLYGLFSLMLTIASRWMPPPQRKWALMAGLSGFVVVVATVAFFLPILEKTQVTRGAGLTGEEITRLVHQFETWNVGRWVVLIGGWTAALRALSLSSSRDVR
jgi:hypothetical protein